MFLYKFIRPIFNLAERNSFCHLVRTQVNLLLLMTGYDLRVLYSSFTQDSDVFSTFYAINRRVEHLCLV